MRSLFLIAVCTAMAVVPNAAQAAEYEDSRSFIAGCQALHVRLSSNGTTPDTFPETFCIAYILGFREAAQLTGAKQFCIPREVPLRDVVAVYVKWAEENRSEWRMPVFATVGRAMVVNYPCRSA